MQLTDEELSLEGTRDADGNIIEFEKSNPWAPPSIL